MCENACMQINWDDMRTILALVRAGSLAGAAEILAVSYTTVARRVQRAEEMLGQTLFERRPEGYSPTTEARNLAAAAERMEAVEQDALRQIAGNDRDMTGPFVLTAPQLLIDTHLAPFLKTFCDDYPQIDLTVRATNTILDLTRREADVAIRISSLPGDNLVGLRLADQKTACFGHPDLISAAEADPSARLDWVIYSGYDAPPKIALAKYPNYRIRARFDEMTSLIAAARAGMGVVRMPVYLGQYSPDFVALPGVPAQDYAPIWVLSHPDLQRSSKIAVFKSALKGFFRDRQADFTRLLP
ncbi:HTH-type transcriptional regulator YofA [Phaeobacter italicus]|nr:HTH-type transcriptional regulator YofA [Phaeobacter italicus]SFH40011.1 transcriptional regulator, LysR family [Phaeobacter italicus]